MRLIDLNDYLCSDNIWARRLLGIEPFQQHRTMDLIEREYNSDFYGKRLSSFRDDLDALRVRVLRGPEKEIVVSIKDQIAAMFAPLFLTIKCQYMEPLAETTPIDRTILHGVPQLMPMYNI